MTPPTPSPASEPSAEAREAARVALNFVFARRKASFPNIGQDLEDMLHAAAAFDAFARSALDAAVQGERAKVRDVIAQGRDALASLWAAVGDRLCAKKPLDLAYGQRVESEAKAASRAMEEVVPYSEIPMRAAAIREGRTP